MWPPVSFWLDPTTTDELIATAIAQLDTEEETDD